jgi:hypothetical protein
LALSVIRWKPGWKTLDVLFEPGYRSLRGHAGIHPAAVVTVFDPGGVNDAADAVHLPRLAPYLRLVALAQA